VTFHPITVFTGDLMKLIKIFTATALPSSFAVTTKGIFEIAEKIWLRYAGGDFHMGKRC
jgi:hypothetical protein